MVSLPPLPFTTQYVRVNPAPRQVAQKIDNYFTAFAPYPRDRNRYRRSLSATVNNFRLPSPVYPHNIYEVISTYENTDRSPGLPYTKMGFHRKDEVDPANIIKAYRNIKWGHISKWNVPCNGVAKSMVGKTPKFRLIWVYPIEMTYIEGMFAQPLINGYQHTYGPYAIWVKYGRGDMKHIANQRRKKETWLGTDWSSFDANVPSWLIRDAFRILFGNIISTGEFFDGRIKRQELMNLWNSIVSYFIYTPVKYPDGSVRVKEHGVPSGSYFTNLIDSVVNSIVMSYLLDGKRTGYSLFMGDDSLISCAERLDLNKMQQEANIVFGFQMNTDKSDYCLEPRFLGYKMTVKGIPISDYERLCAQLLLPSYPDRCADDFIVRAKAIRLSALCGCERFHTEVSSWLATVADVGMRHLHYKSELYHKLKHVGIDIDTSYEMLYALVC